VTALEDVRAVLFQRGISFGLADLHSRPRAVIERSGLARRIGTDMLFDSAEQAAAAFMERSDPASARGWEKEKGPPRQR